MSAVPAARARPAGARRPLVARAGLAAAGLLLAAAAQAYRPVVDYEVNCQGCHLPDGSGEAGRVPSVRRTLTLFSMSPAGRDYVIRVPGVSQSSLSDADTAALLNWMVAHLSDDPVPPGFVPYTGAEVARVRHRPLADPARRRADLLRAAGRAGKDPAPRRDISVVKRPRNG